MREGETETSMIPVFENLDLRSAGSVIGLLTAGARANRQARCRVGSCDVIGPFERGDPRGTLIATGDLHDNPVHLARVVLAAGLEDPGSDKPRFHLTLHELIHSDNIVNETDFSYRVLARAAALKAAYPEEVHVLLANHELAQLTGSEVVKEGVRCVTAFEAGVENTFGVESESVLKAVKDFIRSMPIALRVRMKSSGAGEEEADYLCSHSLPPAEARETCDWSILDREMVEEDYLSRRGMAYWMTWGRGHTEEFLREVGRRWRVRTFILGHEKVETGVLVVNPNVVILNSDHVGGVYLALDLHESRDAGRLADRSHRLAPGV